MDPLIKIEIEKIRQEAPETSTLSDDYIFGMVAYKYFFNQGQYFNIDFKNSHTDASNDGGIDLIAIEEDDSGKNLVLIQSKNLSTAPTRDDIMAMFMKMEQTVEEFKNSRVHTFNEKLKRIYQEKYSQCFDETQSGKIKLMIFLGISLTDQKKEDFNEFINNSEKLQNYEFEIVDESELVSAIKIFYDETPFVDEAKLSWYKDHGKLEYVTNSDGNHSTGIIVNISSTSLREIYDTKKEKGLFDQNFRGFVINKKIDDGVISSINSKPQDFWFLNNGIIIGCKDWIIDGNKIKLYEFSIINGCQTTTNIGKNKKGNPEFPIVCKIIKPTNSATNEVKDAFIARVAESSNSQKKIEDRDLKSNQPEQKKLQSLLKNHIPTIRLEIKRGDKKSGRSSEEKIKNDELGQLILSCLLQQPGTARSAKKKIFSDISTYNAIFKRNHSAQTLYDLIQLKKLVNKYLGDLQSSNPTALAIARNGQFVLMASILFFLKYRRGKISSEILGLPKDSKVFEKECQLDNIDGPIFDQNRPDDFQIALKSVLSTLILDMASIIPEVNTVSNFLKTDKSYIEIILDRFKNKFIFDEYEKEEFFKKFDKVFK